MRTIMAAASFSPAIASRRAKYEGNFEFPKPLGAKKLDLAARA
jgi:hypothetical protein